MSLLSKFHELPSIAKPCVLCSVTALLVLAVVLVVGSFSFWRHGVDVASEVETIRQSSSFACTIGQDLNGPPVCERARGRCISRSACRRLKGTQGRHLGSQCCTAWETLLKCACPVSFEGASAQLAVNIEANTDLNRDQKNWCVGELRNPPYEAIILSFGEGSWQCGQELGLHQPGYKCPAGISPSKPLTCLKGADGKVRVGSKSELEGILEEKAAEADAYAGGYLAAGIVCLMILLSPGFFWGALKIKEGVSYKSGPFSFLGAALSGRCYTAAPQKQLRSAQDLMQMWRLRTYDAIHVVELESAVFLGLLAWVCGHQIATLAMGLATW